MVQMNSVKMVYDSSGTEALHGVDLDIHDGEFVFLVGPSGSGKTTIIKLLTGEVHAASGEITVNGFDMMRIKRRKLPFLRRTLGVIFQDFRLIDKMTVYDNVAFAMRVVGASARSIRKRVPYILSLVGLQHKAKHYPTELSGGERQRIAIARAMLKDAPIVVLDEATAYIDPENEAVVQQAVGKLVAGKTVLVIAHRLSTITGADQIVVVNGGRSQDVGTHGELLKNCPLYQEMWRAHMGAKEGEQA